MTAENTIHVRLNYNEAIKSKRDLLNYQLSLIKIARTVNSYKKYRIKEIEIKYDFLKKMKELKVAIGQLHKTLPKPKIPDILKEDYSEKEYKRTSDKKKKKIKEDNLEEQLLEIQRKLNSLQNKSV